MEIITFNDCRKCGSKPRVRAFGSLHLVTCPECLEETLSDPDLAVLAKRWNELNPTRPVEITLSKAFSPIKEIHLTARIDDLDLETEPETEPEDETDMAPESEPVIPEYCAANPCKCGGDPIYFQNRDNKHTFICRECGQTVSDHMAYSGLVAKWNELNPSGWSHATDFSSFKDPEEGPRDPNIPPVHPIHRCSCGGEPEFYSLLNGPIYFICNKCCKMITGFKPFSEMIADWNKANPLDETERPNLDPGRGPCTCPGFNSPLQYQVGGDHYAKIPYQPIQFFHDRHLDAFQANIIKYLARWRLKNGLEDLKKAEHYLLVAELNQAHDLEQTAIFLEQFPEEERAIMDLALCNYFGTARQKLHEMIERLEAEQDETEAEKEDQ